jgi:hypothetical protein
MEKRWAQKTRIRDDKLEAIQLTLVPKSVGERLVMLDTLSNVDLANSHFEAFLFDCDGTLAETAELHYYAPAAAPKRLGHDMPKRWYLNRFGLSLDQLLKEFKNLCGVQLNPMDVSRRRSIAETRG